MPTAPFMRRFVALPLLILLFSFRHGFGHPANTADTSVSPCTQNAERLLNEALEFMQKNYYRRDDVRWEDLVISARERLRTAVSCDDVYSTISWCFSRLNEQHSFVMPPAKAAVYNNDITYLSHLPALSELVGEIRGELLNDSIAYLTIPWVNTTDSLICTRIADSLQDMIARLDANGVSKWIIDLRKNSGGNCWPMLAGIGPLLGEGICGYFVSGHERVPITYRNGAAFQGRHARCRVSNNGYRTKSARNDIVVLTSRGTVSAGEIVALAFKGRQRVLLYGEPTAGLTTANATYSLSDHSMLVLTICQEADPTGRICEGSIAPDKYITAAGPAQGDIVKRAAIGWLLNE